MLCDFIEPLLEGEEVSEEEAYRNFAVTWTPKLCGIIAFLKHWASGFG